MAKTACRCSHANGTWVILECTGRNCLQDPAVTGFIVNAHDITEQIKLEETLRHQALHDALTDLPNRTFLQQRLDLDVLHRLSALGIHISVDDFGTGYSSLAYLKRLPIDELKIDRSFVQHMLEVETDATIVRSTIMLAHNLGLHIVAEGVEDKATLNLLTDLDCDVAQGYYMSRPIPAAELECWLRTFPQPLTR